MDNDRIAPKDLHKYEPVTRHLADKIAGVTFYADRGQPILKVIDSLAEVKRYKIRDFYKPDLVEQALAETKATDRLRQKDLDKDGKPVRDTPAEMMVKLGGSSEAVADYFSTYLDSYLVETLKPTLADNVDVDKLLNSKEIKELIPLTDGVYTTKKGDKTKQQGYTVPDQKALEQFIKGKLHPDGKLRKIGTISEGELQQGSTSLESYGDRYKAIRTLGEASGINLGEHPDQDKGTITINTAYITLESLLRNTLYQMVKITKTKPESIGASRKETPNIINPESHSYLGRPTNTSFIDMVAGAVEGREMAKLKEQYLDAKSRKDDGGFFAHIENPQEALPFAFDDNDRPTLVKFMANSVAMAGDAIDALQAYRRDNPDYTGYVKVTDIAKYIDQYANDMARGKGLRPEYRQRILNGLTLAGLMGTDYIIDKDRKRGTTKVRRVYVVNRIDEYERSDKTGTILAIKNPDFTDEYKANLANGLNLGVLTDGIRNLGDTETKVLARYIADRQVAKQNDTVEGKPITCKADTLCKMASITDQHVTNRYKTLAKMLDTLEGKQTVVGRWVSKAGGKTITGYNPESQTLYLYPTNNVQKSYATKKHTKAVREASKLEQKARVKALKKYAKGYTDFDVLATEMGVQRTDLDLLLDGKLPITDRLLERIDTDVVSK